MDGEVVRKRQGRHEGGRCSCRCARAGGRALHLGARGGAGAPRMLLLLLLMMMMMMMMHLPMLLRFPAPHPAAHRH